MIIFSTKWIGANTQQGELALKWLQDKISELGIDNVDFAFVEYLNSIEISLKVEFNPKEMYSILFPQYKPTFENACLIFDNTRKENFLPIHHWSETIYKKWIENYQNSPLIIRDGKYLIINKNLAKQLFDEYGSWTKSSKEFPIQLQTWFKNFGIELSLATISYLLTQGMPYSGFQVSKKEVFRYSSNNRSYGIIGTLAYQLTSMLSKTNLYFIPSNYSHPLCQSIFISFARMEYYINKTLNLHLLDSGQKTNKLENIILNSFDENLIFKLVDFKSFELKINNSLSNYNDIAQLFIKNNIDFVNYSSVDNIPPKSFEMSFTKSCNFRDVWLLTFLLEKYGLAQIVPSREDISEIEIGSNIHTYYDWQKHSICREIPTYIILDADPKLEMSRIVESCETRASEEINSYLSFLCEEELWDSNQIQQEEWENGQYETRNRGNDCFSEDEIDDAFEGDSENTWNVD